MANEQDETGSPASGSDPAAPERGTYRSDSTSGAIDDAHLLLWYASREGVDIDQSILKSIVTAEARFGTPEWTADQELEFWRNREYHP